MIIARNSNLLGKITVFCVICCCSLSVKAKYGGGTGTSNDPYLIYDANHMQAIGADANDWDKHFKLMADIDLGKYTRAEFNVIGEHPHNPFTGVFDGADHTISNFTYDTDDGYYVGMFGYVSERNAEIKNLGLIDTNIDAGTGNCVGSLVGLLSWGTLTECYACGGSVLGNGFVGGLVGTDFPIGIAPPPPPPPNSPPLTQVTNCYAIVDVTGEGDSIGGLMGNNVHTRISGCYADGNTVSSGNCVGGLVGYNSGGLVINCYSAGSVVGANDVGGLVGFGSVKITNCYSTCSIVGDAHVGGLVGWNGRLYVYCGTINNSYWDIETGGESNMCGYQEEGATGCDPNYGKMTAEMHQQSTFTNWNFIDIWNIGENQTYPYLRVYLLSDINKDGIVNFLDLSITANQWMEVVE